jgi:uncharacterized hydrophobic protein (TIGR00271 family)
MIHVRLVSPPDLTERLLPALAADRGVRNLVLLREAAQHPEGDAIQFDLLTTSANAVLRQLRDLGLGHRGSVVIETVDATIADLPGSGAGRGFSHREAAPIWEMVEARIRAEGVYPPSFFILLAIAGLIGAVGILTNSQILIVGAMVVGPEYSAIIAIALGIGKKDRSAIREGLIALLAGFLAAIFVTFVFGVVIRGLGRAPAAFTLGVRPVADLINTPNLFSVVVAVLAGIVGVVSLTEARAGALIGVFISVTTIPAASDIGISLAFGSWRQAWGSTVQLLLNIVLLVVVGAAGLSFQRTIWRARSS